MLSDCIIDKIGMILILTNNIENKIAWTFTFKDDFLLR